MRKKFLRWLKEAALGAASVLAALTISTAEVSAEQAAAEQYRQMFRSGNFYVEYETWFEYQLWGSTHKTTYGSQVIAGKNGNRVKYSSGLASLVDNRLTMGFTTSLSRSKKLKKYPDSMYKNGNYYHFFQLDATAMLNVPNTVKSVASQNKKKPFALALPEDQLDSPTVNPEEQWDIIKRSLALPDELLIFYWDDPFFTNPIKQNAPYFNGSSKRTLDNVEYDCDQYILGIKTLAGTDIAQVAYNALYSDGKLAMIQRYFLRDGKETLEYTMKIINITPQVPDTAFNIQQKINVYSASTGDMNDLLERLELIETWGGKK